jgi:hypothetical protein
VATADDHRSLLIPSPFLIGRSLATLQTWSALWPKK